MTSQYKARLMVVSITLACILILIGLGYVGLYSKVPRLTWYLYSGICGVFSGIASRILYAIIRRHQLTREALQEFEKEVATELSMIQKWSKHFLQDPNAPPNEPHNRGRY